MDRVNHALKGDNLAEARKAISMVVGREVRFLDEKGISRAAIETMAENFVDGVLSANLSRRKKMQFFLREGCHGAYGAWHSRFKIDY